MERTDLLFSFCKKEALHITGGKNNGSLSLSLSPSPLSLSLSLFLKQGPAWTKPGVDHTNPG